MPYLPCPPPTFARTRQMRPHGNLDHNNSYYVCSALLSLPLWMSSVWSNNIFIASIIILMSTHNIF